MVVETKRDLEMMAHLMRRAGFGATRSQLEALEEKGYDAVVDELLNAPENAPMAGRLHGAPLPSRAVRHDGPPGIR